MVVGSVSVVNDKTYARKGIRLNGTSSFISTLVGTSVFTSAFSLAFWMSKHKAADDDDRVFDIQDGGPANAFTIKLRADGKFYFTANDGAGTVIGNIYSDILIGPWFPVILTYSNGTANFYVNSVLAGTDSSCTLTSSGKTLYMGRRDLSATSFSAISLSDVRIYNRVITESERTLFNTGADFLEGLIHHWKLESDVLDSVGGKNGTVTDANYGIWEGSNPFYYIGQIMRVNAKSKFLLCDNSNGTHVLTAHIEEAA